MLYVLEILGEAIATVALWLFLKKGYDRNPNIPAVLLVAAFMIAVTTLFNGWNQVPAGHYGVETLWGQVDYNSCHRPGWAFIEPWKRMQFMSGSLENVHPENSEDHAMHIFSKDGVPLKAHVDFTVVLTDRQVGRIIDAVGIDIAAVRQKLLIPSAEAAVSNSGGSIVAHDLWNWSNDGQARKDLERVVHDNFVAQVVRQLEMLPQFSGLSSEELQEVFHISVQLSSVIPGKEVEDALSANAATEQLQAN
ncbi:MAG: hypothetical protein KDD69_12365, partial [Bdellovibrionales bacterium]|nr:hypothetical protein [Bdellovibrionales bacterium]